MQRLASCRREDASELIVAIIARQVFEKSWTVLDLSQ